MNKLGESRLVKSIQLALHYGTAFFIAVLAIVIFIHAVYIGVTEIPKNLLSGSLLALNNIFFMIILLEILSTIVYHPESKDFALRPFMVVGIISGVRHILMVGAKISLEPEVQSGEYLVDLGLHGALILLLAIAYWFVAKAQNDQ